MGSILIVLSFGGSARRQEEQQRTCWLVAPQIGRWGVQAHLRPARRPALSRMTRLPEEVARLLAPLKPYFSYRPYLVFCWLVVAHVVGFEKASLQALARYLPAHGAAWHLRRLVAAGRWQWAQVLEWLVSPALAAFPPPRDGGLYVVGDSPLKGKRTKTNPLAQKGRLNEYAPYPFGLHGGILSAQWEVYRVPLALRLVKPTGSPGYQAENALLREMLQEVGLPAWCQKVVGVAAAA
jgi:hypothetical protein